MSFFWKHCESAEKYKLLVDCLLCCYFVRVKAKTRAEITDTNLGTRWTELNSREVVLGRILTRSNFLVGNLIGCNSLYNKALLHCIKSVNSRNYSL